MFTGIIEELGEVVASMPSKDGTRLTIRGKLVTEDARHGDSIAVDGVCLTVADLDGDAFTADLMTETLSRTTLGEIRPGSAVNLERCLKADGRFGGHIVQGHVDGIGEIISRTPDNVLTVSTPAELARYVAIKGSITVDGVSLTVVEAYDDRFTVGLIPTTLDLTGLGAKGPGDLVNLEVDVLAKYVERMVTR